VRFEEPETRRDIRRQILAGMDGWMVELCERKRKGYDQAEEEKVVEGVGDVYKGVFKVCRFQ